MREFPPVPPVEDAPDSLFSEGHLWIQELVDAGRLRFSLRDDGRIRFGDADRVLDEVPPAYRAAARHVRENLDRDALRAAVEDPTSVVFFGGSLHYRTVGYDFARTPPFLGFDVFDGQRGAFLPPDAVERVFRRLGLRPVDAVEKEVRAAHFDPGRYEIPASAWYDGPALGAVFRDKTGNRAALYDPAVADREGPDPVEGDPQAVARELVTDDRIRRVVERLEARGDPATVSVVVELAVETVLREEWGRLAAGDRDPDPGALRGAAAESVRRYLDRS